MQLVGKLCGHQSPLVRAVRDNVRRVRDRQVDLREVVPPLKVGGGGNGSGRHRHGVRLLPAPPRVAALDLADARVHSS